MHKGRSALARCVHLSTREPSLTSEETYEAQRCWQQFRCFPSVLPHAWERCTGRLSRACALSCEEEEGRGDLQARFPDEASVTMLPGVTHEAAARLAEAGIASTAALLLGLQQRGGPTRRLLEQCLPSPAAVKDCLQVLPPPSALGPSTAISPHPP